MPKYKYPDHNMSDDEWQKTQDKIHDAGMQYYQQTRKNPTTKIVQEILDQQGEDINLREMPELDHTIIVTKKNKGKGN